MDDLLVVVFPLGRCKRVPHQHAMLLSKGNPRPGYGAAAQQVGSSSSCEPQQNQVGGSKLVPWHGYLKAGRVVVSGYPSAWAWC